MTTDQTTGRQGAERLDHAACYRVVSSRDRRFDGVFWTGVRTTGIYCRPSCPARTPASRNVSFHPSAAAAQSAGFRACKRCLPDAVPGDPGWDLAADVAGRAMRLIADGVVDREGVDGLAARLGFTPRHLGRLLGGSLGAGPLALARARRAQTARTLVETTDLPLTDVAFAAGFASVRQFNDTLREVYDATPGELRRRGPGARETSPGEVRVRVPVRTPYAGRAVLGFLAAHLVPGVETADAGSYARTMRLPHGPATARVHLRDLAGGGTGQVEVGLCLTDLRDLPAATARVRRLLDADADPVAVDDALGADPLLAPLVARHPGLRVPGQVEGAETALRTVVGQQVSLTGARTVTGRLVASYGEPVSTADPALTHLFPTPAALAGLDPGELPMPRSRGRALTRLAAALATGELDLDGGADREATRARLLALPGIGPWTADYVAARALGDPDRFLPGDLAVRRALGGLPGLGHPIDPRGAVRLAERWAPWRSSALMHLWHTVIDPLEERRLSLLEDPCGP